MTDKPTCPRCNGDGFYYVTPDGVNPFACRIEHLAQILRKVTCQECAPLRQRIAKGGKTP